MQQILKFFSQNKVGILFLVLFSISIGLTIQSHSYHNSQWVASTNYVAGNLFQSKHSITSYFNLSQENEELQKQNSYLQQLVYNSNISREDSIAVDSSYIFLTSEVISNSFDKIDNFVLLDIGKKHGVTEGSAVSIPNGILGIVEHSSNNYSRVISILNTNLSINAKLKNSNQFGSLKWNGESYSSMSLEDLPRSAEFKIGDTIVTGSNSLIFPQDIPIGRIEDFNLDVNAGYYTVNVRLFADMTNLNEAYVIIPQKIKEAQQLID